MPRRVFEGVRNRVAATGLAAGLLAAAGTSASVEVHGSIGQSAEIGPIEASLVPAPSLYELFGAVLNDDVSRLYPVEATVDVVDGRFVFDVSEPGVRWVRVRSAGAGERAFLLVGPETNTLLPSHNLRELAFCTVFVKEPASAWIVRGGSLRSFEYGRYWTQWPPIRRIEAGRPDRYEFAGGRIVSSRRFETLTIGAPGYEPEVVECEAGGDLAVELRRSTAPAVDGVMRRNGVPEAGAILVDEDGWPVGATDERGGFRVPVGVYHVLTVDGGLDAVEVVGSVAELDSRVPPPGVVSFRRAASSTDDLPVWATVHWTSAGAVLAIDRGTLSGAPLRVNARPGVATTTILAERFAPLTIDWSVPPAALSLEPLLLLEGTVADPTGAGIGGARLSIGEYGARPVAWSDGRGRFLLEVGEPPGQKQLVALAAGYGEVRRDLGEVLRAGRQPIVLELTPRRAIVGRLVAASGGGIRGTVGLAGPWNSERFIGDAALWKVENPPLLQVVETEDDGEFVLEPTSERGAWLVAAAPGHGTVRKKLTESDPGSPGEQQLGNVVLEPEVVLRGRAVDWDGAPVEAATIVLGEGETFVYSLRRGRMRLPARRLTTGPDGRFRIAGLAMGDQFSLRVSAPGFVREWIPLVRVDASLSAEEVEVRLRESLELRGRVMDEVTRRGVEGVRVRFAQTVRGGSAWAETDEAGEFLLRFPAGAGVLSASADGYEDLERPLSEPLGEPLELVLRPKPEIEVTGTVIREGAPVAGASVSIESVVSLTDASGRFAVRSAQGQASLECHVPGASQVIRRQVEVDANVGELLIDVTPVVLRGRVIEPDGLPMPAAYVSAQRDDGGWFDMRRASTGSEGEFELIVEPGSYVVSANSNNMEGPQVEVEVVAGDAPYVELTGPGAGLLRVVVRGLAPAEEGEVLLMVETIRPSGGTSSRGMRLATGGTAAEPVFEMPFRQPEGTTTVIASVGSTGRSRRAPLRMAHTGVTQVELSFADDTGLLQGTVTLDGWPLAGERVFVTEERRSLAWSVNTDHRGNFLIDGLRKGGDAAIAAVGQQRRVRVAETISHVDFEAYSASVRGRMLDAETGLPAAGMRVSAVPAWSAAENDVARSVRRQSTTRTAEDGSFVIDGLFAAPYRLEIRPGGRNLSTELVVGSSAVDLSGGDLEVTFAVPLTEER